MIERQKKIGLEEEYRYKDDWIQEEYDRAIQVFKYCIFQLFVLGHVDLFNSAMLI